MAAYVIREVFLQQKYYFFFSTRNIRNNTVFIHEFKDFFSDGLIRKNKQLYLDLPGINKKQLLAAGIQEKNISDSNHCTSCRIDEYFSYRREHKLAGRIMSVVMLK